MIRTTNLTKRFRRLAAVYDLSLYVPEGSVFALLGLNGAGRREIDAGSRRQRSGARKRPLPQRRDHRLHRTRDAQGVRTLGDSYTPRRYPSAIFLSQLDRSQTFFHEMDSSSTAPQSRWIVPRETMGRGVLYLAGRNPAGCASLS
jgi:hypothetical protein